MTTGRRRFPKPARTPGQPSRPLTRTACRTRLGSARHSPSGPSGRCRRSHVPEKGDSPRRSRSVDFSQLGCGSRASSAPFWIASSIYKRYRCRTQSILYGTAGMRKRSIITLGGLLVAVPGAMATVALTLVIPPQRASAVRRSEASTAHREACDGSTREWIRPQIHGNGWRTRAEQSRVSHCRQDHRAACRRRASR